MNKSIRSSIAFRSVILCAGVLAFVALQLCVQSKPNGASGRAPYREKNATLEPPKAEAQTFPSISGLWKGEQNQRILSISQAGKKLWVHGLEKWVCDMWFEKPDLIKGAWGGNSITGQLSENGNRLDILYYGAYRRADPSTETAEQKASRAKEEEALRAITELETYLEEFNKAFAAGSKYGGEALAAASKAVGGSIDCPSDPWKPRHPWCGWFWLDHYSAPSGRLFGEGSDVPNQAWAAINDSIAYLNEARSVDGRALEVMRSQMAEWRKRKDTLFKLMDQLATNWAQQTAPASGTDKEKEIRTKQLQAESDRISKEIAALTSPVTSMRKTITAATEVTSGKAPGANERERP